MRINSKYARGFGAVAIAAAALAATGAKAQDLTLWTLNFDNGGANTALKKVATDFEAANPGTHIELSLIHI